MINTLKPRLATALFALVLVATAAFGAWATVKAYHSLHMLISGPAKAEKALAERYQQLGNRLDSELQAIHTALLRSLTERDTAALTQFDQRCAELRTWLNTLASSKVISRLPLGFEYDPSAVATQAVALFDEYVRHARYAAMAAAASDATNRDAAWQALAQADHNLHGLIRHAAAVQARADFHLAAYRAAAASPIRELLTATALLFLAVTCGFVAVTVYRTELLPLRRQLQARDILLEQQKHLVQFGKLAPGLAHEIRNPLTAINARLFVLERALPADSPVQRDASVIRHEIARLDRVVNDFLQLARPAEPRLQLLTAEQAFRHAVELLEPALAEQGVRIGIGTIVADPFQADPEQLKQVLINLIQNAAESFSSGGEITLSARRVQRTVNGTPTDFVALDVQDNGPGISPAVQQRLFEPFFTTKRHGSGLGLSISLRIVERHGGTIEFATTPGAGTTFTVLLPLHLEAQA